MRHHAHISPEKKTAPSCLNQRNSQLFTADFFVQWKTWPNWRGFFFCQKKVKHELRKKGADTQTNWKEWNRWKLYTEKKHGHHRLLFFILAKFVQWRSSRRSQIQLYNTILNMVCSVPRPLNISETKKSWLPPNISQMLYSKSLSKKITPIFLGGDMQSFLDNNLPWWVGSSRCPFGSLIPFTYLRGWNSCIPRSGMTMLEDASWV